MFDAKIFHIKTPTFPEFRFEWHPQTKRVYLIRITAEQPIGEPIAMEIETAGAAHNAVLIFLRGYRAAKAELPARMSA